VRTRGKGSIFRDFVQKSFMDSPKGHFAVFWSGFYKKLILESKKRKGKEMKNLKTKKRKMVGSDLGEMLAENAMNE